MGEIEQGNCSPCELAHTENIRMEWYHRCLFLFAALFISIPIHRLKGSFLRLHVQSRKDQELLWAIVTYHIVL